MQMAKQKQSTGKTASASTRRAAAATKETAAAAPSDDQISSSALSLHELFEQQTRQMLDRTDLDEEQKQNILVAMSCPCCGAGKPIKDDCDAKIIDTVPCVSARACCARRCRPAVGACGALFPGSAARPGVLAPAPRNRLDLFERHILGRRVVESPELPCWLCSRGCRRCSARGPAGLS